MGTFRPPFFSLHYSIDDSFLATPPAISWKNGPVVLWNCRHLHQTLGLLLIIRFLTWFTSISFWLQLAKPSKFRLTAPSVPEIRLSFASESHFRFQTCQCVIIFSLAFSWSIQLVFAWHWIIRSRSHSSLIFNVHLAELLDWLHQCATLYHPLGQSVHEVVRYGHGF